MSDEQGYRMTQAASRQAPSEGPPGLPWPRRASVSFRSEAGGVGAEVSARVQEAVGAGRLCGVGAEASAGVQEVAWGSRATVPASTCQSP